MTIEFNIPEKKCQCIYCGRVRVKGVWTSEQILADTKGICPVCGDNQKRAQIRKLKAGQREVRRNARTPHPVREMTESDWEAFKS